LIRRASPPLRRDGRPVSTATWYLRDDGRVLLNMDADRKRLEQMRHDPRVALDLLDESDWYTHVSMTARLEKLREDTGLADIDRLAPAVHGQAVPAARPPLDQRGIAVDGWHRWGALKDSSQPG
jgi:Pyridoxamine 5'-phosphate oxidase